MVSHSKNYDVSQSKQKIILKVVFFRFLVLLSLYSSSLGMVVLDISSNTDEVLLTNPSAVFVFGDFNVHDKDWLTYSGATDRPGELL